MKHDGYLISCTEIVPGRNYLLNFEAPLQTEHVECIRTALEERLPGSTIVVLAGLGRLEVKPASLLRSLLSRLGSKRIRNQNK